MAYFELADIYLSLSEHEGFGVPILEAFYKKIPVIAFDAGAVGETMNGGGVLVQDKDFFRIAALVDVLVRDRELRGAVIRGQLRALQRYSRDNVAGLLRRHVREVTGE